MYLVDIAGHLPVVLPRQNFGNSRESIAPRTTNVRHLRRRQVQRQEPFEHGFSGATPFYGSAADVKNDDLQTRAYVLLLFIDERFGFFHFVLLTRVERGRQYTGNVLGGTQTRRALTAREFGKHFTNTSV